MQIGSIISRDGVLKYEVMCYQTFPDDSGHVIGTILVGIRELKGEHVFDSDMNPVVFYTEIDVLNHFYVC